jgi:heme exporter protein B
MMTARACVNSFWWLIHKDVTRELRARHTWPGMVLLGLVLVSVLAMQLDLPPEHKGRVGGSLIWLAIFFSGTLALDRSFANERESGCWQSLARYPAAASLIFLAKMTVNLASLVLLELILIPAFIVMTDIRLLERPWGLALVAALGNIGFAAVGTLISALTADLRSRGGMLALLLLPLVTPVILASAEATSLLLQGNVDQEWWRWIQLLAIFATVFTVLGALVFEVVMEE